MHTNKNRAMPCTKLQPPMVPMNAPPSIESTVAKKLCKSQAAAPRTSTSRCKLAINIPKNNHTIRSDRETFGGGAFHHTNREVNKSPRKQLRQRHGSGRHHTPPIVESRLRQRHGSGRHHTPPIVESQRKQSRQKQATVNKQR